jgi:tRNA A37 N6-isopentenylltransferase MiaA
MRSRSRCSVETKTVRGRQPSLRSEGVAYVKIALAVAQEELDRRIARRVEGMPASELFDGAARVGAGRSLPTLLVIHRRSNFSTGIRPGPNCGRR